MSETTRSRLARVMTGPICTAGSRPLPTLSEAGSGGNGIAEPVFRFADGDGDADGEAALAGASEGRVGNDLGGGFLVGIGQDHDVIFCAALALHAFAACRAARVHVFCDGRGSDEADGAHQRMIEQGVDGGLAAVDEVDDAGGQAGFLDEFEKARRGEGHAVAGFQDDGVSGGDGVGQEPQRNHQREIEGRDDGADAEGLPHHDLVDAGRDVFEGVALHQHGNAAGDFDIFNAAAQFAFGFGKSLAVFGGDDGGEFVEVGFEQDF